MPDPVELEAELRDLSDARLLDAYSAAKHQYAIADDIDFYRAVVAELGRRGMQDEIVETIGENARYPLHFAATIQAPSPNPKQGELL